MIAAKLSVSNGFTPQTNGFYVVYVDSWWSLLKPAKQP